MACEILCTKNFIHFLNSSVKIELILIIFDAQILTKFDISGYEFVHHIWKNVTTLSCESCVASYIEVVLSSPKSGCL